MTTKAPPRWSTDSTRLPMVLDVSVLSDETVEQARCCVRRYARDADEVQMLLELLGLDEEAEVDA